MSNWRKNYLLLNYTGRPFSLTQFYVNDEICRYMFSILLLCVYYKIVCKFIGILLCNTNRWINYDKNIIWNCAKLWLSKDKFYSFPDSNESDCPFNWVTLISDSTLIHTAQGLQYMLVWNCIKSAFMNIGSIQKCKKIILKKLHFRVSNSSVIETLSLIPVFWLPLNFLFSKSAVWQEG